MTGALRPCKRVGCERVRPEGLLPRGWRDFPSDGCSMVLCPACAAERIAIFRESRAAKQQARKDSGP